MVEKKLKKELKRVAVASLRFCVYTEKNAAQQSSIKAYLWYPAELFNRTGVNQEPRNIFIT